MRKISKENYDKAEENLNQTISIILEEIKSILSEEKILILNEYRQKIANS
jgi:hypothetical protein